MSLDRTLQLTTAAVAVLGALFLALGYEAGWLPALLAVSAGISVVFADVFPWLRLNRYVANVIAVAAVAWSLYDFLGKESERQLMAIAQMLVYLQILLLFQERTARVYWQLMVLSLLQVVVAAALNSGPQFGLLLTVYMMFVLVSLVLLSVHREVTPGPAAKAAPREGQSEVWRVLLRSPEVVRPPVASGQLRSTTGSWPLARQVVTLAAAILGFTFIFFYVTPRHTDGQWHGARPKGSGATGFSTEVAIKESGRIHVSNQVVMRAMFRRPTDRKPYPVVGDPYFHGGVLTDYRQDVNGVRWSYATRSRQRLSRAPDPGVTLSNRVRQEYILEMTNAQNVFAMLPVLRTEGTPQELRYYRASSRIVRNSDMGFSLGQEYRYAFQTSALRNGRQVHAIPHGNPGLTFNDVAALDEELSRLRSFDSDRFSRLKAIAAQILRDANLEQGTQLQKALALERHFFPPGAYRYTLNLDFRRDPELDPIEDFVANHRSGHCEYFATALAMMLRSQGIPARLVVGYKGGDFNMLGQYYVVRQKHAHAWVEAWLPPDAVPPGDIAGIPHRGGTWYRLDPTPASSNALVARETDSLASRAKDTFDYVEILWRDYVLNLNSLRQRQEFLEPATARTVAAMPGWIDPERLERWMRRLTRQLGFQTDRRRGSPSPRLFDWRPAMFLVVGLVTLTGGWQLMLALYHRLRQRISTRRRIGASARRAPEFYERLERILSRLPLVRSPAQTPHELALAAEGKLYGRLADATTSHLPAEIVAAYYRVRFGGAALDNQETEAIEHALAKLVPAVSQAQKR
jgi:hypothetical protein